MEKAENTEEIFVFYFVCNRHEMNSFCVFYYTSVSAV